MIASENSAEDPANGNTFITRTRCCGISGLGKANMSVMSATGSPMARGPETWSDMSEDLLCVHPSHHSIPAKRTWRAIHLGFAAHVLVAGVDRSALMRGVTFSCFRLELLS